MSCLPVPIKNTFGLRVRGWHASHSRQHARLLGNAGAPRLAQIPRRKVSLTIRRRRDKKRRRQPKSDAGRATANGQSTTLRRIEQRHKQTRRNA